MMRELIILIAFCPLVASAQLCGKVVDVHDGDTFTLLAKGNRKVKIRLHGIDCPELKQDFGDKAQACASNLLMGKQLCVDSTDADRYGRIVAIVKTPWGRNVNKVLLRRGLAWHYKKYDNNPKWANIENKARKHKRGLWQQRHVAPWVWR